VESRWLAREKERERGSWVARRRDEVSLPPWRGPELRVSPIETFDERANSTETVDHNVTKRILYSFPLL
jgi:hypothetical protein